MAEWHLKGRNFSHCNCAYGCPCQFNALPTEGHCRAAIGYLIEHGRFGDTDLAGTRFGRFHRHDVARQRAGFGGGERQRGNRSLRFDSGADTYEQFASAGVARNPRGPAASLDPTEPGIAKRVQRGGSFLCTDQYCSRYMVGTRGKGAVDTGTNHVGFRCVRSPSR